MGQEIKATMTEAQYRHLLQAAVEELVADARWYEEDADRTEREETDYPEAEVRYAVRLKREKARKARGRAEQIQDGIKDLLQREDTSSDTPLQLDLGRLLIKLLTEGEVPLRMLTRFRVKQEPLVVEEEEEILQETSSE